MHSLARFTLAVLALGSFLSPGVQAIAAETPKTQTGSYYPASDGGVRSLHVATLLAVDGQTMTVEDKGTKWTYAVNEKTTYCVRGKKSTGRVVPKVLTGKVLRIISAADVDPPPAQPTVLMIYDLDSGPIELRSIDEPPVFPACK